MAMTGCTGGHEVAPGPFGGLPDGVSISLVQLRGDIAVDRVQLRVDNESDAAVAVTSAILAAAAFEGEAAWDHDRDVTVPPGRVVDLPVLLPPVQCARSAALPGLRVSIVDDSGTREIALGVTDEQGVLERLESVACDREAVEQVVAIEAVAAIPRTDGVAVVEVALVPTGATGSVQVVGVRGTPLLKFSSGEQWPLTLSIAGTDAPSTAQIEVVPRRCDAHAIAEDKVGTRLDLIVEVDGREAAYPLPLADGVGDALLGFTASACGLG